MLYETAAICLHLVDTHPQAELAPAVGSTERAHFYKRLMCLIPHQGSHLQRVLQRPALQRTIAAEGLVAPLV